MYKYSKKELDDYWDDNLATMTIKTVKDNFTVSQLIDAYGIEKFEQELRRLKLKKIKKKLS